MGEKGKGGPGRTTLETIKIFTLYSQSLIAYYPNAFTLFKDLNKFVRKFTLTRFYNMKDPTTSKVSNHDLNNTLPIDDTLVSWDVKNLLALGTLEEL